MKNLIQKIPTEWQKLALEVALSCIERGVDSELVPGIIENRINHELRHSNTHGDSSRISIIEELNSGKDRALETEIKEQPTTPSKLDDLESATIAVKGLIDTQAPSDLVFGYSSIVQMALPTSKKYDQIRDPITQKVIALHRVPAEQKRQALRYQRTTGKETIVWATTMPDKSNFTHKGDKFGEFLSEIEIGLPYGCAARLILCFIFTEAKRTNSPVISLGKSIREIIKKMGIVPKAGKGRNVYSWTEQLYKLRYAAFSHTIESEVEIDALSHKVVKCSDEASVLALFESSKFWWDASYDSGAELVLNKAIFEKIIEHSVPCDLRIMTQLYNSNSALAMDLWHWGQYRMNDILKKGGGGITRIPLKKAFAQFSNEMRLAHFGDDLKSAIAVLDKVTGNFNPIRFNEKQNVLELVPRQATVKQKMA